MVEDLEAPSPQLIPDLFTHLRRRQIFAERRQSETSEEFLGGDSWPGPADD
jgi:hypothetical protein